jgi:hypothetical protein
MRWALVPVLVIWSGFALQCAPEPIRQKSTGCEYRVPDAGTPRPPPPPPPPPPQGSGTPAGGWPCSNIPVDGPCSEGSACNNYLAKCTNATQECVCGSGCQRHCTLRSSSVPLDEEELPDAGADEEPDEAGY